jgi:hypothetical protein
MIHALFGVQRVTSFADDPKIAFTQRRRRRDEFRGGASASAQL